MKDAYQNLKSGLYSLLDIPYGFDFTTKGRIVEVLNNHKYRVLINGDSCTAIATDGSVYNVGQIVWILFAQNDKKKALIFPDLKQQENVGFNKNILINCDFSDPINQRNQTNYTSQGYTIDQWRIASSSGGAFKLEVKSNGICFSVTKAASWATMSQYVPPVDFKSLIGKPLTFTINVIETTEKSDMRIKVKDSSGNYPALVYKTNLSVGINSITTVIPEGIEQLYVEVGFMNCTGSITLSQAELEIGNCFNGFSSMKHRDRLVECQNYYKVIGSDNGRLSIPSTYDGTGMQTFTFLPMYKTPSAQIYWNGQSGKVLSWSSDSNNSVVNATIRNIGDNFITIYCATKGISSPKCYDFNKIVLEANII